MRAIEAVRLTGTARRPSAAMRRRQLREGLIEGVITLVALTGIAAVVLIFVFVAREAIPLFTNPDLAKETDLGRMFLPQVWRPGRPPSFVWQPVGNVPKYSMIPLLVGTVKVTIVAMVVAAPIGVAAAVFTSEFAPRRLKELLKPTIELLAGIPSVVLGFFALMVMATWLQSAFGFSFRLNAIVAGLGLALTIVPVVFTVSEDALAAVPRSYREASLALGFGRAIGETMIVLMASGNAAITAWSFGESVRTLPATIAAEMGEVVVGGTHYAVLFFIGVELFVFTFALNGLAAWWLRRLVRRMSGSVA